MTYATDNRLRSYLDANQLKREQLCLAVLSAATRYTEDKPRHPRGGPDGGREIEAMFRGNQRAYGAVGFVNGANDSKEQKKKISAKFRSDLDAALAVDPKPDAFVFLTNLNFTVTEKATLVDAALKKGLSHCEIFDRELIRITLDNPDGFAIRFQTLDIPLSEAEQASFFSKWGDVIQSTISTGFQQLERSLQRILFFQEADSPLPSFTIAFELDRTYDGSEIGHFRAFCYLRLKGPVYNIFSIIFGSSDKSTRMREVGAFGFTNQKSGILHGFMALVAEPGSIISMRTMRRAMKPMTRSRLRSTSRSDRSALLAKEKFLPFRSSTVTITHTFVMLLE